MPLIRSQAGREREPGAALRDCLFLAAIAALSAVAYLPGLGFYADDYAYLSSIIHQGPLAFLRLQPIAPRPLMGLYEVAVFKAFGLDPLPGHIVNHLMLIGCLLLFYGSLTLMRLPRLVAVGLPLVFLCLPHYATVRFWFTQHQIVLSAFLFFLSLYASQRFAWTFSGARWWWLLLAALAMLLGPLSYEVFLPLYLLIPLVTWLFQVFSPHGWEEPRGEWLRLGAVHFMLFCLIALILWRFKLWSYGGYRMWQGDWQDWLGALHWMVAGVLRSTFIEQGAKLPQNVANLLRDHWRPLPAAVALASFLAIFLYIRRITRRSSAPPGIGTIALLTAFGLLVFVGGYLAFLNNFNLGFSPTGITNRTAIAGAIGVAALALAVTFLIARLLPGRLFRWFLPGALALGCATGVLIIGTLGVLWTEAAKEQEKLLTAIRRDLPQIASGTTLLLDGFCPFVGPGPVFESSWDLEGALRILYDDPSLSADIVKPGTRLAEGAVTTVHYGKAYPHPFGPLLVYNARAGRAWPLPDRAAAEAYFARFDPAQSSGCRFEDGEGVSVYRGGGT